MKEAATRANRAIVCDGKWCQLHDLFPYLPALKEITFSVPSVGYSESLPLPAVPDKNLRNYQDQIEALDKMAFSIPTKGNDVFAQLTFYDNTKGAQFKIPSGNGISR